jgi:O-antigen ligase
VITLPFDTFLILPATLLLFLNWLIDCIIHKKSALYFQKQQLFYLVPFVAFYLLYIIAIFYSDNKYEAVKELEYKWSFIVFPLLFSTFSAEKMNLKKLNKLLLYFVLAMGAVAITNFILSTLSYQKTAIFYDYFYTNLSHFMHPSYQSLYACTAFIIAFYALLFKFREQSISFNILLILLLPIFVAYIIMLQSKSGIMFLLLAFLFLGIYRINYHKNRFGFTILFLLILGGSAVFMIKQDKFPVNRMTVFLKEFQNREDEGKYNGSLIRLKIWKVAIKTGIEVLPFGTGTGDVQQRLNEAYQQEGLEEGVARQYNAHNQFIQTFVALGIPGLLLLLSLLAVPLVVALRSQNMVLFLFTFGIFIFLFSESMFERYAGSNFILLMMGILINSCRNSSRMDELKTTEE